MQQGKKMRREKTTISRKKFLASEFIFVGVDKLIKERPKATNLT